MKSTGIHHHPPPLSTVSDNLRRFSTHAPPPAGVIRRHRFNNVRTKPMAATSSHLVVLAVAPPAATAGDISVLIPTSVAFIFLYWIANFVVPEIIMKDLESDEANKDQSANDQNPN